jgi:hypothetical protein
LKLDKIYTYYATGKDPTTIISPANYPEVKPYYLSTGQKETFKFDDPSLTNDAAIQMALDMSHQHNAKQKMLGTIIDPFSDIHLYSGILPIKTLKLPPWALQTAMQQMTAFFHMGPLLITTPNLQKQFNPDRDLTPDYNLAAMADTEPTVDPTAPPVFKGIPIPAVKSADWNWLQAFAVRAPVATTGSATTNTVPVKLPPKKQHWNPFVISSLDNKPKFEQGPYTAVEGFLQLKAPIMTPETL